jgi:hypothetical protein
VAILKANNSGLLPFPGRLATIPSQPRTLTATVTLKQAVAYCWHSPAWLFLV